MQHRNRIFFGKTVLLLSIISKVIYAGADFVFSLFLFFVAPPIPGYDVVGFFLFGRALMNLIGAYIPPYTLMSKLFYGLTDQLMGLFFTANSGMLGGPSSAIGTFLLIRGTMTWINIEL